MKEPVRELEMVRKSDNMDRQIRSQLPDHLKHCEEVVMHISCNCFELVRREATWDVVLTVFLAAILLAVFIYAAYVVWTSTSPSAFDWTIFGLSFAALLILICVDSNKRAAIHKIKYKRFRDAAPWFSVSSLD